MLVYLLYYLYHWSYYWPPQRVRAASAAGKRGDGHSAASHVELFHRELVDERRLRSAAAQFDDEMAPARGITPGFWQRPNPSAHYGILTTS